MTTPTGPTPEERITALENNLQDFRDLLVGVLNTPPPPPPPPVARRWAARATPQDWTALMDWVDRLIADYSLFGDHAPLPCWPAHPGAVEELAGLWRAWTAAALTDATAGNEGSEALTVWHDRALWPALHRLERMHYATSSCRDKHEPDRTTRPVTDRSLTP